MSASDAPVAPDGHAKPSWATPSWARPIAWIGDLGAVGLSAFAIYVAGFGVFDTAIVSGGMMALGMLVALTGQITGQTTSQNTGRPRPVWALWNVGLILVWLVLAWVWLGIMLEQEEFFIEITVQDHVMAWIAFAIIAWITWRMFGLPIVIVYLLGVVYLLLGDHLPAFIGARSEDWARVAENLWYSTDGVFGRPVEVVTRIVLIFIVFGAVLNASGAGATLLKFAFAATGRFAGGPAHASIVGSAMFGTLSGAAIANVVSTGVFTIPIIKRAGFPAKFAGAVEAAASTGGQIMPPVMGVVAFLMADITGIPYLDIVTAALIPALFYYASLFGVVLIEARRLGIKATPAAERDRLNAGDWLRSLTFFIPLGVIVGVLLTGRTPQMAGFTALIVATLMCLALFPEFRSPAAIWRALVAAGRTAASLMVIVAAIGFVIGVINMTGIGLKFAQGVLALSGESLLVSLFLVMAACLIMGMGVPTGAAYLIIAIVLGPALEQLGLPTIVAHLFVVYFGVLSVVTPPVALAAFAAAPIAGSKPMETGFTATRLSIAGFIIPFIFVYHPDVLLITGVDPLRLAWAIIAFALSTWSIATGLGGFERAPLPPWNRMLRVVCGIAVLIPDPMTAGAAGVVALLAIGLENFKNTGRTEP